jgi:hypothetical protein
MSGSTAGLSINLDGCKLLATIPGRFITVKKHGYTAITFKVHGDGKIFKNSDKRMVLNRSVKYFSGAL